MRLVALCVVLAVSYALGQEPCGCPYTVKKCDGCDATKLAIVENEAGKCTITCERGYMLQNPAANYVGCENGRDFQGQARDTSTRIPIGSNPALTCVPASAKTCEAGTWQTIDCKNCDSTKIVVSPGKKGACTITCDKGYRLVADFIGSIQRLGEATLADGAWQLYALGAMATSKSVSFEHAPFFNCERIPAPKPVPKPCICSFTDAGAALDMEAPVSNCANGITQTLKCDGKIYVMNEDKLIPYDNVSCSAGSWYGTSCDGTNAALNTESVKVQCGVQEPPICPQLPHREGIKYIGTENGLQRYTCGGDDLARLTINGDRTVLTKYFECNSTFSRAVSSNGGFLNSSTFKITDLSCRDYGKLHQACSVPVHTNAWLQDGVLRCFKGFYLESVTFFDPSNKQLTGSAAYHPLKSAKCEAGVWKVDGLLGFPEVQLSSFICNKIPSSGGNCGALVVPQGNVQFIPYSSTYSCFDTIAQEMKVVTPAGAPFWGFKLQCVSGAWTFSGKDVVTIPAGSKISCVPNSKNMGVLPPMPLSLPLVPVGKTAEGLTRWACIDSTIKVDLVYNEVIGGRKPIHAPYLECNNTYYQLSSSVPNSAPFKSNYKISHISCEDMGSKYPACSDPWDMGGIRSGNHYECHKGFFLYTMSWSKGSSGESLLYGNQSSSEAITSMECHRDGWRIKGTDLSGVSVSSFSCLDANPIFTSGMDCSTINFTYDYYKLQFDYFKKEYTCYRGESMAYTLNSVRTVGGPKKLFCGTNAATKIREWQWSYMDGTEEAAIPAGARISCF